MRLQTEKSEARQTTGVLKEGGKRAKSKSRDVRKAPLSHLTKARLLNNVIECMLQRIVRIV